MPEARFRHTSNWSAKQLKSAKPNPYAGPPDRPGFERPHGSDLNRQECRIVRPKTLSPLRRMTGMLAIVLAVFAIGPGVVSLAISQRKNGQRMVTYDSEVSFFGFAVDPTTAQWLSVTTGPALLFAGVILMRPITRTVWNELPWDGRP